jgi:hypothetical protein
MSVLAQLRRALARRPWLYWAAVGALALLVGVLVSRATSQVEAARNAWGETRGVIVATVDVRPGEPLAGATEQRQLPTPMVPVGAVGALEAGAMATQRIAVGEVVMAHDIGATAGPQTLIPEGWLAVPIAEPVPSGVRTGDDVAVASGGVILAADAIVVGVVGESVLVAAPGDEAPHVAQAAASGDVALLIKR